MIYTTIFLLAVCIQNSSLACLLWILTGIVESTDLARADYFSLKAKAGTADFLVELENRRSIKVCNAAISNISLIKPLILFLFYSTFIQWLGYRFCRCLVRAHSLDCS